MFSRVGEVPVLIFLGITLAIIGFNAYKLGRWMRRLNSINTRKDRLKVSDKLFSKRVFDALVNYVYKHYDDLLKESAHKPESTIYLKLDKYTIHQKLPEFDLDLILVGSDLSALWDTLKQYLKDYYIGLIAAVECEIVNTGEYGDAKDEETFNNYIVKVRIIWRD